MNTQWKPISYPQLVNLLAEERQKLEETTQSFWDVISLPVPELWQQHPWGDESCGFWVVAVAGRYCIYYNDISGGFSYSVFQRWAMIQDFNERGISLQQVLTALHDAAVKQESLCS